jgi:hypothetical integral membrane protein (TIGR02206 family)
MTGERLVAAEFQTYGTSHLVVLAVFAVGIVGVILIGSRLRNTPAEVPLRRTFAVAIVAVALPLQILQFIPSEWDLQTSLPLALCDYAWLFAVHALWTRNALSATITYLWGITLTTQGIFTPDLGSEFPELRFLMFWGMHLLIVWTAVLLVFGLRVLPTWRAYRITVVITVVWAVFTYVFNVVADTNYGYLNRLPDSASLLDLLGPWPVYVVLEILIVLVVWALLTWPWTRGRTTGKA